MRTFLVLLLLLAAQNLHDEVVALLDLREGMTVADVGAGTGDYEGRLSRAVGASGRVLAIEIDGRLVTGMQARFAREGLTNVEARLGQPADPGLDPLSVDRILLVDTWHHLTGRRAFAGTLLRALKRDGRLVIVDYTLEAPSGPPAGMRVDPQQLLQELEAAGYSAHLVEERLPDHYVVVASPR